MRVSKNQVTLLSAAVAALFAAGANAQVVLGSSSPTVTASTATVYASEISNNTVIGTTGITVNTILGIGTSINQDRYVKISLSNATFASAVTNANLVGANVAGLGPANITPTVSFGGAAGATSVIFQITTPAGANITDGLSFNMVGGVNIASTASTIGVTYEVYEFLAQAQDGKPFLYARAGNVATFTPTYVFRNNATPNPTQVATAISGFKNFNFGSAGSAATAANAAVVGKVDLATVTAPGKLVDGTTNASVATVLANAANSQVTVTGDFSAAAANTSVTLGSTAANGGTAFTTTTAVFNINGSAGLTNSAIGYVVNGTTAVPAISYAATLSPRGATGYTNVTSSGAITTGSIARDGVQFESPWVTATTSYISRFFLLQTSGSTITWNAVVRNVNGAVTGGTLTGTLESGKLSAPITLASLLPATPTETQGGPYQVTFNIASDASVTQGTYVLTNTTSNSVSNMPLYRATQR
ncbi:MAG: hypothetical protein ACK45Y_03185 [Betaproteobacteria bacterium]